LAGLTLEYAGETRERKRDDVAYPLVDWLATEVRDFYAHVGLHPLLHDGFGVMVVGNGSLTLKVDVVEREGKKVTSFNVRMSFWPVLLARGCVGEAGALRRKPIRTSSVITMATAIFT
jgi:hypothetical protein